MGKKNESKKSEIDILLPEKKIGDYTICPWGICEIAELSPILEEIRIKLEKQKVKLSNLTKDYSKALPIILPYAVKIIAVTLNIEEKEVKNIKPRQITNEMVLEIFYQNFSYLKNLLGLVVLTAKNLQK